MVEYSDWVKAMHRAYKNEGGEYGSEAVSQTIVDVAAEVWNEHKEQILEMAMYAAVEFATRVVRRMIFDA